MATAPYWAIDSETFDDLATFTAAFTAHFNTMPEATVVIAADKAAPVEPLMQTARAATDAVHQPDPNIDGALARCQARYQPPKAK